MDSTAGILLFFLLVGAPPMLFVAYALGMKRWRFRRLTPYMVGYAFLLSVFLSAYPTLSGEWPLWIGASVVAVSTIGTWAVWRVWAGALEAIEELRKQRGIK